MEEKAGERVKAEDKAGVKADKARVRADGARDA
jgi:hypothetical protein